MASTSQVVATPDIHGPSYTRPPFFDGTDYAYWRNKMEMFLDSEGVNLWDIIEEGWSPPTKKDAQGNEVTILRKEWSDEQTKANLRNRKAITILYCGLSREEYNGIEHLKTTKEIWECLRTKHEGTNQLKNKKLQMLGREYELFEMKPNEKIGEMYGRLITLVNAMRKLGKKFSNEDVNNKILVILPQKLWEAKISSIEEAHDLSTLPTDELLGKLLTHEIKITQVVEEEKTKNDKSIALKASRDTSDSDSNEDNEEFAMISRRIRNLIMKKRRGFKKQDSSNKNEVICYGCNKPGHIKSECPKLKKTFKKDKKFKKEKKQALKATWDDSSESSDDDIDEEIANLYFMALEEPTNDEVTLDFESNDEMLLACEKLMHKCDKYLSKINSLKEKMVLR